jgi:hypothetical protein
MKNTLGTAAALAVLLAAGCSDGSSASASATNTPAPGFGRASHDDLVRIDLPIYPWANAADSDVIKKNDDGLHKFTLMTTTYQSFRTVDEWYAEHLDSEFGVHHLGSADAQSATYAHDEPDDATGPPTLQRSVTIESVKDAKGRPLVVITLQATSTSTAIPHKDWH